MLECRGLTRGVNRDAEAAGRQETSIPEESWEKRFKEATSGVNDWLAAQAPVVQCDCAVTERHRRDQLEPSRAG